MSKGMKLRGFLGSKSRIEMTNNKLKKKLGCQENIIQSSFFLFNVDLVMYPK